MILLSKENPWKGHPNNLRPITLLNTIRKIFTKILTNAPQLYSRTLPLRFFLLVFPIPRIWFPLPYALSLRVENVSIARVPFTAIQIALERMIKSKSNFALRPLCSCPEGGRVSGALESSPPRLDNGVGD